MKSNLLEILKPINLILSHVGYLPTLFVIYLTIFHGIDLSMFYGNDLTMSSINCMNMSVVICSTRFGDGLTVSGGNYLTMSGVSDPTMSDVSDLTASYSNGLTIISDLFMYCVNHLNVFFDSYLFVSGGDYLTMFFVSDSIMYDFSDLSSSYSNVSAMFIYLCMYLFNYLNMFYDSELFMSCANDVIKSCVNYLIILFEIILCTIASFYNSQDVNGPDPSGDGPDPSGGGPNPSGGGPDPSGDGPNPSGDGPNPTDDKNKGKSTAIPAQEDLRSKAEKELDAKIDAEIEAENDRIATLRSLKDIDRYWKNGESSSDGWLSGQREKLAEEEKAAEQEEKAAEQEEKAAKQAEELTKQAEESAEEKKRHKFLEFHTTKANLRHATRDFNDVWGKVVDDPNLDEIQKAYYTDEALKLRATVEELDKKVTDLRKELEINPANEYYPEELYSESDSPEEDGSEYPSSSEEESRPNKRPRN